MNEPLPEGWARTTVGGICLPVEKADPRWSPDLEFEYIDIGGVDRRTGRIIRTKSIRGAEAPSRARQLVRTGDTVLSTVRVYLAKIAIVPARLDNAIASTGFSVLRPAVGIHPMFLMFQTLSDEFLALLDSKQTGTSYPAVRDRDVRKMPLRIAPSYEQERIVQRIEDIFTRLNAVEMTLKCLINRLRLLRSAVLADAFCADRDLPPDWISMTVGDVAEVQLGRQRSPKHHTGKQLRPYLRAANVTWDGISLDDVKEMNFDDREFERYRLEPHDLLLNEASGTPSEVGKPAIWGGEIKDCCFQNTLLRLRPQGLDLDYLYWYCYFSASTGRFGEASRGVNIRHLGKRGLSRFPIPVAPHGEQSRIADDISNQFHNIRLLRESIEDAQNRVAALRRSVLAEAFAGRLVPQDPEDEPASVLLERIAAFRPTMPRRRRKARA